MVWVGERQREREREADRERQRERERERQREEVYIYSIMRRYWIKLAVIKSVTTIKMNYMQVIRWHVHINTEREEGGRMLPQRTAKPIWHEAMGMVMAR